MAKKSNKITKSHTSSIEAAKPILKVLENDSDVTKISLGRIKSGLSNVGGNHRVKITVLSEKALRLSIRGNISHQEITVFTKEIEKTQNLLVVWAKKMNYQVATG